MRNKLDPLMPCARRTIAHNFDLLVVQLQACKIWPLSLIQYHVYWFCVSTDIFEKEISTNSKASEVCQNERTQRPHLHQGGACVLVTTCPFCGCKYGLQCSYIFGTRSSGLIPYLSMVLPHCLGGSSGGSCLHVW